MWGNMDHSANFVSLLGIFLYGCAASVHCVGMCGGITMSLTTCEEDNRHLWRKQVVYHLGRLLTGLLWGIFLGITGELLFMNSYFRFLFPTVCGGVLIYMGISRMGIIDRVSVPAAGSFFHRLYNKILKKGTLPAGLLTELLPCGMLNTVQVYAAGTGNIVEASASMLAFIAGTIPVLYLFGIFHGFLTKMGKAVVKISAVITVLLGLRLILKAVQMLS